MNSKPVLGVINGFELLEVNRNAKKEIQDIEVRFLIAGRYLASTKANNIPDVAVEKVRETLVDFCQHNLTIEQQCQAISLPTMIMLVENIVKKYS